MLPQFYKFITVNNSGQTLTFTEGARLNLKVTGWFITPSTGKIDYTQLSDDNAGFPSGTVVDGDEVLSTEIDNTSNLFLGLHVQLEVTHDEGAAADGTFVVFMEGGDATGELPSDASGYGSAEAAKLGGPRVLTWEPNGGDDEVMRSDVWEF
jgi:hypothetical protein